MKRAYISLVIISILVVVSIVNYNVLKNISDDIKHELMTSSENNENEQFAVAYELFNEKHSYLCAVTYHSEIDYLREAFVRAGTYLALEDYDDYSAEKQILISTLEHIKENERFILANIF